MPYISYVDLAFWLNGMYIHAKDALTDYYGDEFESESKPVTEASPAGFLAYCRSSTKYSDVFVCEGYRKTETKRRRTGKCGTENRRHCNSAK